MSEAAHSSAHHATTASAAERVFLVGVDFHDFSSTSHRAAEAEGELSASAGGVPLSDQARQAREAARPLKDDDYSVPFTPEESLAELHELATSAGGQVVGEILQRRDRPEPATLIGSGKVVELAGAAALAEANLIIFDHELTASQLRNLEKQLPCRVVDRTQLILDIFARHARTREGQLQVELAQLEYMLPRLGGRGVEMSQLGGGIGTRGPGETQLETDRRKIHRRIRHVKEQIEEVRRVRQQQRQRRESIPVPVVALVGYTNAGKSTLFNALTGAEVLESARMFATLDPTLRTLTLPSRRPIVLSDTVGFIRNLPTTLVSAFRATLEEVQRASLLLEITDATSPTAAEQMAQVAHVLGELDALATPRLHVLNKIDLLDEPHRQALRDTAEVVPISATRALHFDRLLAAIDAHLTDDPVQTATLRIPQAEGKALSLLEAGAVIRARRYLENECVELEVEAAASLLVRLGDFVVKGGPFHRRKRTE